MELNYRWGKFEVMFKCMSGFTTETGKFIMPFEEKLTYKDSMNRCDSRDSKKRFHGLQLMSHKLWHMLHDRGSVTDLG